jgi:ParB/RepB/Spo0J family partition protein
MNAPTRAADLADPKLELIPLTAIAPSETHIQQLRRKRYDLETLKDLAASIGKLGVQQPGVVRKLKAMRGLASYELVAGERRWRASRLADTAHFPAIVRELTDAQVLEIQLVENIQRETLHELEEAVGYEELMKVGSLSAEQVAEKVGKSRSWVYSRLNLLRLDGAARQALEEGRLDVSRALIVARVTDPEDRAQALQLATEKRWNGEGYQHSVRDLMELLGKKRITMHLRTAPFALDDTTFFSFGPKDARGAQEALPLPACTVCPKRTGNCDPEATDPDVCTDTACFAIKVKEVGERRRRAAAAGQAPVIRGDDAAKIATKKALIGYVDLDAVCKDDEYPEPEPEGGDDDDAAQAAYDAWQLKADAWQPRTYRDLLKDKSYKAVLIEIPGTKKVIEAVSVKEARDLLKKADIKLSGSVGQKPPPPQKRYDWKVEQAKRDAERKKQEAEEKRVLTYRGKLLALIFPKALGPLTSEELHQLAIEYCGNEWHIKRALAVAYGKVPAIGNLKDAELGRLLRIALFARSAGSAHQDVKPLLALAKRYKVDLKDVDVAAVSEDGEVPAKKKKASKAKGKKK